MPGLLAALDHNAAEAERLRAHLLVSPFEERLELCAREEFRSLPLATRLLFESEASCGDVGHGALSLLKVPS